MMLDGGVDMPATFDSFKSCSHLLTNDSRSFKSKRNVLTYHGSVMAEPVRRWICDQKIAGSIPGRRRCATTVGKLIFLATLWPFIELLRSLVVSCKS